MESTITKNIEQAQYTAAPAVKGAWKGTSKQRQYEELGWESMYDRRWYRRLCHFFQLRQSKTQEYLFNEIPPEQQIPYIIRNPRSYDPKGCKTERFSNSYFTNTVYEFNLLESEIKDSKTISQFKRRLLSLRRPVNRPVFMKSSAKAVKHLTQLRLHFSPLNAHRFRHNFDRLSPLCVCGEEDENNEYFFLHCHLLQTMRNELFGQLSHILGFSILDLNAKVLCEMILYGSSKLNVLVNRHLIEATLQFIQSTKRFS